MKNVVSKVFVTLAVVISIVGLVCFGISMMDFGNNWVLIAGQICVCIGMAFYFAEYVRKNKKLIQK